ARRAGRRPTCHTAVSPEPIPRKTRPGAYMSTVAALAAITLGWRVTGFTSSVPTLACRVACAAVSTLTKTSPLRSWLSGDTGCSKPAASASRQVAARRAGSGKPKRLVPNVSGAATRRSDGQLRAFRVRPVHVEELPARRVHPLVGMRAEVVALCLE